MKTLSLGRSLTIGVIALLALAGAAITYISSVHADTTIPAPVISNTMVTPSQNGATILWSTDQNANSQVFYGLTSTYDGSSTLNTASEMSHTSFLGGLTPSTLYHYQIATANASGTLATSTDATFTTLASSSATTSMPVISNVMVNPTFNGGTITWLTDQSTSTQVNFGTTSSYGSMSTLDNASMTNHTVILTALLPSTLYHFQVLAGTATSTDYTFTTLASSTGTTTGTSTSTPTSGDIQALIDKLKMLQDQIASISQQLQNALSILGGFGGGTTTPPTNTGGATIQASNGSVQAGGNVDFGGRGFGHEETVSIMRDGVAVGTVHADGGGNFSTGSMSIAGPAGTHTYVFTGQSSGFSANTTVTVQ